MTGHPDLKGGLPDLDAYLHIITCDECSERHGDAVLTYGQALLAAATVFNSLN